MITTSRYEHKVKTDFYICPLRIICIRPGTLFFPIMPLS